MHERVIRRRIAEVGRIKQFLQVTLPYVADDTYVSHTAEQATFLHTLLDLETYLYQLLKLEVERRDDY